MFTASANLTARGSVRLADLTSTGQQMPVDATQYIRHRAQLTAGNLA